MVEGIHPAWPVSLALLATVVIIVAGIICYRRFRGVIAPSHLVLLTTLRILGVLLLLLMILSPFRQESEPDPDAFQIGILADSSGSMSTRDLPDDRSRFEALQDDVLRMQSPNAGQGLPRLLNEEQQARLAQFSEDVAYPPSTIEQLSPMPGRTDIGQALESLARDLDQNPEQRLGAVVLLSDGHSNEGPVPTDVAKDLRRRGIPVSTIGLGRRAAPGDVSVRFLQENLEAAEDEELRLQAQVRNTFDVPREVNYTLLRDNVPVRQDSLTLQPGESRELDLRDEPLRGGNFLYRLKIETDQPDANPGSDLAYLLATVNQPLVFRLYSLAARPNWEQKFLQRVAEDEEQLHLKSIVRTGDGSFTLSGFGENSAPDQTAVRRTQAQVEALLKSNFLAEADAFLLEAAAAELLPEETRQRVVDFVANKGGGLLVLGDLADLPPALSAILPVTQARLARPDRDLPLRISSGSFFSTPDQRAALLSGAPLFLPRQEPIFLPEELKVVARPLLEIEEGGTPVMAAQAYGSGRVSYLGAPITWAWRMRNADGLEQHRTFWSGFLSWLSSASKPRIENPVHGRQLAVDEAAPLDVSVRGADFQPAATAKVSATITAPSGEVRQINLAPSVRQVGDYVAQFSPSEPGEYEVNYRARLPRGEELTERAFFTASFQGTETQSVTYREDVLRDIARITGGEFRPYNGLRDLRELPLAENLPVNRTQIPLTTNWPFLLILVGVLTTEWFVRRRIGLR